MVGSAIVRTLLAQGVPQSSIVVRTHAESSWPEYMMRNHREKTPVSQKIQVPVGGTPKHIVSYSESCCYITV